VGWWCRGGRGRRGFFGFRTRLPEVRAGGEGDAAQRHCQEDQQRRQEQALSDKPDSGAAVKALFHSAEDTIRMWEACEAAAPNVDVP
jgi:hypothetical protein